MGWFRLASAMRPCSRHSTDVGQRNGEIELDSSADAYAAYRKLFSERLAAFGAERLETLQAPPQIRRVDPEIEFERWKHSETTFLISRGCARHSVGAKGFDEFVIEESGNGPLAFELLSFVVYFHLTFRPVLATDVLAIGRSELNRTSYSHIYVSVPFFWPGDVNLVDTTRGSYHLNWLMPIVAEEAAFIESAGSDEFERKLNESGYDFFDVRNRLEYLGSQ